MITNEENAYYMWTWQIYINNSRQSKTEPQGSPVQKELYNIACLAWGECKIQITYEGIEWS